MDLAKRVLRKGLTLSVEPVRRPLCDELYAFSVTLSSESRDHWQKHADTCHEVHVLRDEGKLVGFQLWRWGGPILWGGKLRFSPTVRRQGLHLLLNLVALESSEKLYRVGLVNVHGYLALQPALATWQSPPLDGVLNDVVAPELRRFCDENSFHQDAASGRVDVGQTALRSPDEFSEDWWARPAVAAFRRAGGVELTRAETFDRRFDVFLCWEWNDANVATMRAKLLSITPPKESV